MVNQKKWIYFLKNTPHSGGLLIRIDDLDVILAAKFRVVSKNEKSDFVFLKSGSRIKTEE